MIIDLLKDIMLSEQYMELSTRTRLLLHYCLFASNYSYNEFTFERKKWNKDFKLYKNEKQFYLDMTSLIENGFIEKIFSGKTVRKPNIYKLSSKWKEKRVCGVLKNGYIYIIKIAEYYKIGKTINKKRFSEYTKLFEEPKIVICKQVKNYDRIEALLLQKYKDKNIRGEWFDLNDEDLKYIENYLDYYK